MSSESDSQPQVDSAYQDALAEDEDPQLNWNGKIQYEDDSERAEFVATDHRLLYRTDGVMKNMGLNHVSSVETSSETETSFEGSNFTSVFILGMLPIILGIILMFYNTGFFNTVGFAFFALGIVTILWGISKKGDFEGVTQVETTIHHIRLIRANEEPLHITTKQNVGSDLSRLITEAQSN